MSGIAGLYGFDRDDFDETSVREMTETISHRGPDGSDVWYGEDAGLGHQLFATTPEAEHADLPMEKDGLVITADCRIDNRDELFAALDVSGPREKVPDCELILEAYREWGEECPEKLLGAFAFAVWDSNAERLFCARDHMGVKRLYYHQGDGMFAFGSEIKSVLAVEAVPYRVNEVRIGDMLAGIFDKKSTFYEEVFRLQPGHSMVVDFDGASLQEYWSLDPTRTIKLDSFESYVERFQELFAEAVRCRLRSNLPVGSTLSGGLDSSSVACMARDLLDERGEGNPLPTFSVVFDEVTESDERTYIETVLAQGGFDFYYIYGDQTSPLEDIEASMDYLDEPVIANNLFLHREIYREAETQGVQVLLDGAGGDQTLSKGKGYFENLLRMGRFGTLVSELNAYATIEDEPIRSVVWSELVAKLAPEPARILWRWVHRRPNPDDELNPVLDDKFIDRIGLTNRYREYEESWGFSSQRQYHHQLLDSATNMLDLEMTDALGSRFGIEPRFPMFDKRLVEFCLAVPDHHKLKNGWSRVLLRESMDRILPSKIQWRSSKGNLAHNFYYTLREHDGAINEELLENDNKLLNPFVDSEALRASFERFRSGDEDNALYEVWWPISLEMWLQHSKQPNQQ